MQPDTISSKRFCFSILGGEHAENLFIPLKSTILRCRIQVLSSHMWLLKLFTLPLLLLAGSAGTTRKLAFQTSGCAISQPKKSSCYSASDIITSEPNCARIRDTRQRLLPLHGCRQCVSEHISHHHIFSAS